MRASEKSNIEVDKTIVAEMIAEVSVGSIRIETNSNVFHSVVRIKIHKERDSALFRVIPGEGTNKEGDHYNFGEFLVFVRRVDMFF